MSILSVGEILWDVFENGTETLAGAPLNVTAALNRLGDDASLISAVGRDERGQRALRRVRSLGIETEFVKAVGKAPTGVADIRIDSSNNPSYSIVRPAAFDFLSVEEGELSRISALCPEWLYIGTLTQTSSQNEKLVSALRHQLNGISCFYDLNLRKEHWNLPLVQRLAQHATVLKLNEAEAQELFALESTSRFSIEEFCNTWSSKYEISIICITLGSKGCILFSDKNVSFSTGYPTTVVDTVGAGDAFTAGFLHGLLNKWTLAETAKFANALGAIVAGRATAIPEWTIEDLNTLLNSR